MEYRILVPFGFELFDGQALEKFFPPFEIVPERGDKEAFAETPGTAQEIHVAGLDQLVHHGGLVHIDIAFFSELSERLYVYRKFHHAAVFGTFQLRRIGHTLSWGAKLGCELSQCARKKRSYKKSLFWIAFHRNCFTYPLIGFAVGQDTASCNPGHDSVHAGRCWLMANV